MMLATGILIGGRTPASIDGKCPPGWPHHLCGDGPDCDMGRTDIPHRVHRTVISNLFSTCQTMTYVAI